MSGRDRPGVIVGAGIAGVRCAQRVRRLGFSGRLVLVDAERALPYARPPLSKEVLAGKVDPKDRPLASARSYEEAGIELWLGRRAVGLDLDGQRLWLDRDEELAYRWIVLATGLRAASLPGGSLGAGVHTLRTGADAIALRAALRRATKVTVIGAGLIGGEVAAVARQAGLEVTILEAAEAPFARAMGTQLAGEWEALHRAHGVTVESGAAVVGVERRNGNHEIMLADGRCVTADVVVCAVGSRPNECHEGRRRRYAAASPRRETRC